MSQRRTRGCVSAFVLGVLLFAQVAIALAACVMQGRTPALAFSQQVPMPCHEEPVANPNLCLAHCTSADQSADTPQVAMPAWIATAPLTVASVDRGPVYASVERQLPPRGAGPPLRILFQIFLI